MKRILFPCDLSEHSIKAFGYAFLLAQRFSSTLVMLHAYGWEDKKKGMVTFESDTEIGKRYIQQLKDFALKHSGDQAQEVNFEYIVQPGFPEKVIAEVAADEMADLIIFGLAGKAGIWESLFGRVGAVLLRESKVSILAIPKKAKAAAIGKIIFSFRFESADQVIMDMMKQWSTALPSKVRCVHFTKTAPQDKNTNDRLDALRKAYRQSKNMTFESQPLSSYSDIFHFLDGSAADLLVILRRKDGLLKFSMDNKIARNMIADLGMPVLILSNSVQKRDHPTKSGKISISSPFKAIFS